jgi:4-hydroxy-tetrahydrodipicolinate reductase
LNLLYLQIKEYPVKTGRFVRCFKTEIEQMKIALIGYGKMGHAIEQIALQRGHEIVSVIDVNNQEDFMSDAFKSADVAIEFSMPAVAMDNYRRAFAAGVPVVSGTTGWLEHLPEIKEACKAGQTFFYASNFSLGVNIFFALNKYLAKIMNDFPAYDVRMVETHHVHKLDAPSGTAITLAEGLIDNIERKNKWVEGKEPAEDEIGICSVREGEVPGIHTVIYESDVDTISITHDAKSRMGFALGAVVAAEFTCGKKGFLTMQDMLKF